MKKIVIIASTAFYVGGGKEYLDNLPASAVNALEAFFNYALAFVGNRRTQKALVMTFILYVGYKRNIDYLIAGLAGTMAYFAIQLPSVYLMGIPSWITSVPAFGINQIITYRMQKKTFNQKLDGIRQILLFMALIAVQWTINTRALYYVDQHRSINYFAAQILISLFLTITGYYPTKIIFSPPAGTAKLTAGFFMNFFNKITNENLLPAA